jgi:hypothetical protein
VGSRGIYEIVESVFSQPELTHFGWEISESSAVNIHFFDNSDPITSTTSLVGDLADIFVNALDNFA